MRHNKRKEPKYTVVMYGNNRISWQYTIMMNNRSKKIMSFFYDNDGEGISCKRVFSIIKFFKIPCHIYHKRNANDYYDDLDKLNHGAPIESIIKMEEIKYDAN